MGRSIMTHLRVLGSQGRDENDDINTYKAAFTANVIMNERLGIGTRWGASRGYDCERTIEQHQQQQQLSRRYGNSEKELQKRLLLHAPSEFDASLLPDDPFDQYTIPEDVTRQEYCIARPLKYVILHTGIARARTHAQHARHPHDTRTRPSERTHTRTT